MKLSPTIKNVEDFWDNQPCNIKHSNKKIGTKDYFDEVEKKRYFVEPHIIEFAEFAKWSGKKVLEVGCGIGTDGINFARNGADYTCTELSSQSLEITKKRFEVENLQFKYFKGNAEELTQILPIQKFDLIYSFGVIHHSPNPEKIIKSLKEYMNKNSQLKIMLYAENSWKNIMIKGGFDQPEAQYGCPIAKTYTKNEVNKLLSDFKIISIKQNHIFPYKIQEYKKGKYVKQPYFDNMSSNIFSHLQKELGWHLLIDAKLKN